MTKPISFFDTYLAETEMEEGCTAREMLDDAIHLVTQSAENLKICHSGFLSTDPKVLKIEAGQLQIASGVISRILNGHEAEMKKIVLEGMRKRA